MNVAIAISLGVRLSDYCVNQAEPRRNFGLDALSAFNTPPECGARFGEFLVADQAGHDVGEAAP